MQYLRVILSLILDQEMLIPPFNLIYIYIIININNKTNDGSFHVMLNTSSSAGNIHVLALCARESSRKLCVWRIVHQLRERLPALRDQRWETRESPSLSAKWPFINPRPGENTAHQTPQKWIGLIDCGPQKVWKQILQLPKQ